MAVKALTSLELLNPTPSYFPDKTPRKSSTAIYLEGKARRILEYIDRKDFSHPEILELAVPEFEAVGNLSIDWKMNGGLSILIG